MPENTENRKKITNLETELYLLIAKFLRTGPCKRTAEVLQQELEEHELLPKRTDWLGNEHKRSFNEIDTLLSQISDDHLLRICSRIGPILDKEFPPTVSGLTSLLGVGGQSLLRTKEESQKPRCQLSNLMARQNGLPFFPSHTSHSSYPPNITQVLTARESSGPISIRHAFSPKIYARQQLYRRLLGHLSSVYCVLFDRTGKYIFTGADDLLVKIWSATDCRLLAALRGHSAEITDMAVNYENTLLAAGSCDKTIRVWCLRTIAPIAVLSGHTAMVTSLQFCPFPKTDNQLLISTGNDGCICFWHWNPQTNVFNPKPIKFTERNKAGAQMICSSFSPGGLFLATGSTDHSVRVYNIAASTGPDKILEREIHTDRVDSLQFSHRGCRFISGSKDGTALIWKYEKQNWSTIQLKMTTKLPGETSNEVEDSKLKLRVTMVGWTLDDSKVVTAVSDFSIKVWNSYTGTLINILKGHEDEVFVLEPHPVDSRIFLSSGHDGRIILWDLLTGSIIKNHFNLIEGQGHGAVFDCKFSPDGLMFASTDSHGHLSVFGFGSNEKYKKVPEEQFFHTDYRPLIRDINHHVLDEQTQTAPHLLPPPFLVDIDGNPYPPQVQRLVPGRENCNESQLIPYVAVSAAGDSEILEPVRPANEGPADRPTIDDMIQRLQEERMNQDQGSSNQRNVPESPMRSPHPSLRSQSSEDNRNQLEPFSPRSLRHSRVGLRRTGDVEGVQSVGNWQSRGNQAEATSWITRVVVRPVTHSLAKSFLENRRVLANHELSFYHQELKRRLPDTSIQYYSKEKKEYHIGSKAGLRSRTRRGNLENSGEEFDNSNRMNSSSGSETEQEEEESSESSDDSESGEYSDWSKEVGLSEEPSAKETPKPSTSCTAKSTHLRRRRKQPSSSSGGNESEDDEATDIENGEENGNSVESRRPKKKSYKKKSSPKKKSMVNGKKLPERFRPPEWLTDVMPHKAPYVPQIGDEIVYFRQGHELYVQAVKRNRIYDIFMRSQPWRKINLRDQEIARIEDITFENHPPRLCCLKLLLLNPADDNQVDSFVVKYHDMADVIDFIVLRQTYDHAMYCEWKPGDRFRSAIDKAWWLGTIKSQKPLHPNYPDSMFQCFLVKWDNGEKEQMSPWDFEPIDNDRLPEEEGGSVEITQEERQAMMYIPELHEWSKFGRDHDCDRITRGLSRIMELSVAEPFVCPVDLNSYPTYAIVVEYPMDLGTIKARLQNRFYRRLEAVKFDVKYIALNAQKFNESGSRIVKQAKCVVNLCIRFIESTHCHDPMIIYHDMMEAKQSRSQDSQSELDVLCSELDSDVDESTRSRLKRRKHNTVHQSNKHLLNNAKYTSSSWKRQVATFLESIFHMDDSTPFRYPVNLNEYPDYRDIIDCPMDLSTVQDKLDSNHYDSPTDFCKDMRLIFQNSRNYNTDKKSRIYSMTIRLSAMFEEHIRGIISDWRSAVKYEEKIRNNQYVSNRRRPIPAHEADVNVGASTSRSMPPALPSTSREGSRHISSQSTNVFNSDASSSRNGHSSGKMVNGLKRLPHLKKRHAPKSPEFEQSHYYAKKNHQKRNLRCRPLKEERYYSQKHVSNSEGSSLGSNASNNYFPKSKNDTELRKSKRLHNVNPKQRKKYYYDSFTSNASDYSDSENPLVQKKSNQKKYFKQQSSLKEAAAVPSYDKCALIAKPKYETQKKKNTFSPLQTRSQRSLQSLTPTTHSSRRKTKVKKDHFSDSSEFDYSEAEPAMLENSNSSGYKQKHPNKIADSLTYSTDGYPKKRGRKRKLSSESLKLNYESQKKSLSSSPLKTRSRHNLQSQTPVIHFLRKSTAASSKKYTFSDSSKSDDYEDEPPKGQKMMQSISSSGRKQKYPSKFAGPSNSTLQDTAEDDTIPNMLVSQHLRKNPSRYSNRFQMNSCEERTVTYNEDSDSEPSMAHSIKDSLRAPYINGVSKKHSQKRKLPFRLSKKQKSYNLKDASESGENNSDSNASNSPESENDIDWRRKSKRLRKETSKEHKEFEDRDVATHEKFTRSSALARQSRHADSSSRSPSPDYQPPKKNSSSPLHTRAQGSMQHNHSLRRTTMKPKKYSYSSSDFSDHDDSEPDPPRKKRFQNTSSSSGRKQNRPSKSAESSNLNSFESEEATDEEERPRTRATTRDQSKTFPSALEPTRMRKSPRRNSNIIQTRSRGKRTEDSEDSQAKPVISYSSRGRLRKLTNHVRAFFRE